MVIYGQNDLNFDLNSWRSISFLEHLEKNSRITTIYSIKKIPSNSQINFDMDQILTKYRQSMMRISEK